MHYKKPAVWRVFCFPVHGHAVFGDTHWEFGISREKAATPAERKVAACGGMITISVIAEG